MIITLTTDIGWEYAAEMKGVIYSINPDATIVDVTHYIESHHIKQGAFILYSIVPYFKNAVHLAVVDPGVGTERKAIAIECQNAWFVGPDNGIFWPAASRLGIKNIYEISVRRDASPVFHGRDVFAPVAALISAGKKPEMKRINEIEKLDFPEARQEGNKIIAEVLFIDKFGNIITNARIEKEKFIIGIKGRKIEVRKYPSYGFAKKGEIIAVTSSSGFLEISARESNASRILNLNEGDTIEIFF